jgi:hypothetical protein
MSATVPLLPAGSGWKSTLTSAAPEVAVIGMLLRPVYRGSVLVTEGTSSPF